MYIRFRYLYPWSVVVVEKWKFDKSVVSSTSTRGGKFWTAKRWRKLEIRFDKFDTGMEVTVRPFSFALLKLVRRFLADGESFTLEGMLSLLGRFPRNRVIVSEILIRVSATSRPNPNKSLFFNFSINERFKRRRKTSVEGNKGFAFSRGRERERRESDEFEFHRRSPFHEAEFKRCVKFVDFIISSRFLSRES